MHRPCLRAFCELRALPAALFGPRDFAPLIRLARARALDAVVSCHCSWRWVPCWGEGAATCAAAGIGRCGHRGSATAHPNTK
jgi:hypothetical protein